MADEAVQQILVDEGGDDGLDRVDVGEVRPGRLDGVREVRVNVAGGIVGVGGGGWFGHDDGVGVFGSFGPLRLVETERSSLEDGGYGEHVLEIECRGFLAGGVALEAAEQEGSACEGTPNKDFAAVADLQEDALSEEPLGAFVLEVCDLSESRKVAFCDASAEWSKSFSQPLAFLTVEKAGGREAAEDQVRRNEIDEDETTLFQTFKMALVVGGLESKLRTVKVTVGKMITAKVVEESHPLRSRKTRKWRRLLIDIAEDLLCVTNLSTMEEEFQAEICSQVNSDSSSLRFTVAVESRCVTTPLAEALFEGFADHIGGALNQGDSLPSFLGPRIRLASGQVSNKIRSLVKPNCKSSQSTR